MAQDGGGIFHPVGHFKLFTDNDQLAAPAKRGIVIYVRPLEAHPTTLLPSLGGLVPCRSEPLLLPACQDHIAMSGQRPIWRNVQALTTISAHASAYMLMR